ncbi:hypothetical protein G5714_008655 [Onychostoma macrolepis]|uniref:AIG1-type G domain-containing protein n=1 Tax=Onychostoma macrolepis TaxID=369639 RepID=A0A7J6CX46_9TELE|nr:hypothetical protein G5714_008655 [Onychostoma macrolepis]
MVNGRKIKVIDTYGIYDTKVDEDFIKENLIRSLVECAAGVPVLTIVLKIGRYTSQEEKIKEKIWEYFSECNLKHSVILFTHGEQLEGQTIEEFVRKSPKLQEIIDKCGGRCHVIDNKYWKRRWWGYRSNRVQVRNLMRTIDKMVEEKGCYTNELFQMVEEEIQQEIENIKEIDLSPEEKREKAKHIVLKKLLIRFAGVTAGALTVTPALCLYLVTSCSAEEVFHSTVPLINSPPHHLNSSVVPPGSSSSADVRSSEQTPSELQTEIQETEPVTAVVEGTKPPSLSVDGPSSADRDEEFWETKPFTGEN